MHFKHLKCKIKQQNLKKKQHVMMLDNKQIWYFKKMWKWAAGIFIANWYFVHKNMRDKMEH